MLKKGEAFGSVESVKAASDVYAPLSGKVVAINEKIKNEPSLINKSPYDGVSFVNFYCDVRCVVDQISTE